MYGTTYTTNKILQVQTFTNLPIQTNTVLPVSSYTILQVPTFTDLLVLMYIQYYLYQSIQYYKDIVYRITVTNIYGTTVPMYMVIQVTMSIV